MEVIAVDHVQFAVRSVAVGTRYLLQHGYELVFQEVDFNLEARSYFRSVQKSMSYLKRGTSRVELITGADQEGYARYIPVFGGFESPDYLPELEMGHFQAFWHDELSSVCASGMGEAPILKEVVARASRPDHSLFFWRLLGFELTAKDDQWYTLMFPSNMLSMPLTVFLARMPFGHGEEARVDDLGCSSIALVTRNLCADRATLQQKHYTVSEVTHFRINRKPLTICIVSGPSGELVELLEPGRN